MKKVNSGGVFDSAWNNPPKAFNPAYRPYAKEVQSTIVKDMEREGWYKTRPQEERAAEIRRRYIIEMANREPAFQAAGGVNNKNIFHPIAAQIS